jgi:hypothetical protein
VLASCDCRETRAVVMESSITKQVPSTAAGLIEQLSMKLSVARGSSPLAKQSSSVQAHVTAQLWGLVPITGEWPRGTTEGTTQQWPPREPDTHREHTAMMMWPN